jgi:hypothetical protein
MQFRAFRFKQYFGYRDNQDHVFNFIKLFSSNILVIPSFKNQKTTQNKILGG